MTQFENLPVAIPTKKARLQSAHASSVPHASFLKNNAVY
jgi:hypothetical protein